MRTQCSAMRPDEQGETLHEASRVNRRRGLRAAPGAVPWRLLVILSTATLVLAGCASGGQPPSSGTPRSPTTRPSSTPATPSATGSSGPAESFDPAILGAAGSAPSVVRHDAQTADGVTTEDITFSRTDVPPTDAYLVRPALARSAPSPAVVWFHWLESGAPTSNRTEFLDEARTLAMRNGVVSLLVQGTFPWTDRPTSLDHDVAAVAADVRMLRAGLDLVAARDDVDPHRIALVGHDFGAMYASVVFGTDDRPAALVMLAPTARWGDWFLRYWPHSDPRAAYFAGMAPIDPVTALGGVRSRPVLLQFGSADSYVPASVATEISNAAGQSAEVRTYDAGHELDDAARDDRDAWLARTLRVN
jgi:predicted esterase